jgi:hypothetical protein
LEVGALSKGEGRSRDMSEPLKLAFGALASAAVVAGILYGLISRLSRPTAVDRSGKKPGAPNVLEA